MLDPDKYEIHVICDNTNYQFGIERVRQIQNTEMLKQWDHSIYVDPAEHPAPATAYAKAREAIKAIEQSEEMIQLCESAILRSDAWVQEYKRYILELASTEHGTTSEGYKWKPMLEGIRDQLPLFRDLLYDQQLDDYTRLEVVEKIRREVMELLAEHIYFRIF